MTWERSSEIAKGLYKSLNLLTLIEKETRLVFFTDGHESPPIRPDVPPKFTGTVGDISGVVIGVGGDETVEIPKFDEAGNRLGVWNKDEVVQGYSTSKTSPTYGIEHLSALREDYLQRIAEDVGLEYHRLLTVNGFVQQIEAKNMGIARHVVSDIRWVFALMALILLVAVSLLIPRLATP
jgi:mxaL protein